MFKDTAAFSSFAVSDTEAARAFYGDVLGIEVSDIPEAGLLQLNISGGHPVMVYPRPDHVPATYTILNFPVPDVEAAVDALTDKGVTFERYEGFDQDEKGISRGMGPDIAWFTDPSGNLLAVLSQQ